MKDIDSSILERKNNRHLAGIIPISGSDLGLSKELLVHPCLTRIAEDLLAIERAVLDCNYAGCKTIWIVCNEDMQPIIRSRVGDYITSFSSLESSRYSKFSKTKLEYIPVFYCPVPLTLRKKRDSLGWSILHAANQAFHVSAKISKWVVPNKYFVSFPYGISDPKMIRENKVLLAKGSNVFFQSEDRSIATGDYLPFTFCPDDYKNIRNNIKSLCSGSVKKPYWSSRDFKVDKFFNYDNIVDIQSADLGEYFPLVSWSDYTNYINSSLSQKLAKNTLQKMSFSLKEMKGR